MAFFWVFWQSSEWQKHAFRLQLFWHGSLEKWLYVRGSAFLYMTCWKMKSLLCLSSNRLTEGGWDDDRCQQTTLYHALHPLTNKQLTDMIQCTTRKRLSPPPKLPFLLSPYQVLHATVFKLFFISKWNMLNNANIIANKPYLTRHI